MNNSLKILGCADDVACELCGDDGPTRRNVAVVARFDGEDRGIVACMCSTCRAHYRAGRIQTADAALYA